MNLPSRKFQRQKEAFKCEQCNTLVHGDGYTNHCPKCLWSKHVDIMPGDRSEECRGLMKPLKAEASDPVKLTHRCQKCGFERKNRVSSADDFDAILNVMRTSGS